MGAAKYITKTFQNEWKGKEDKDYDYKSLMKSRTIDFRASEEAIVRLQKPTNIISARQVGYKAKQGVFAARVRVRKGHGTFHRPKNKRRPKRQGQTKLTRRKSTQAMAEEKASRKFANCEAIGSYKIAEDGKWHYFEVILVDRAHPSIVADKELWFVVTQKGRAERGKNYAGAVNKDWNHRTKMKSKYKKSIKNNTAK